jgi:hypothetical protein
MEIKPELGKLERIALSNAFVSNSANLKTEKEFEQMVEKTIGKSLTSDFIVQDILDLYKNFNTGKILEKGWDIIRKKLLPVYLKNADSNSDIYNYDGISGNEKSRFWKQCVCLLSMWKFVYSGHREDKESKISVLENYTGKLPEYERLKKEIEKIAWNGKIWLDKIAQNEYGWRLPPVYQVNNKDELSIQEQAMFLFTRSHLSYKKVEGSWEKMEELPLEPVQHLINAKKENRWCWADNSSLQNNILDSECSVRATCLAMTALCDIYEFYEMTKESKNKIQSVGENSIKKLANCQYSNGAWPKYLGEQKSEGDILATGAALYFIDRFSKKFKVGIADQILNDAQMWLSKKITATINSEGILEPDNIENVGQALPALARSCPYLSVIWYRKVFKRLFESSQSNNNGTLTTNDAWQLYAIIEILRRDSIAEYLERIV